MWDNIGRVKENQRDMEFIPDARRDSINSVDGTPINEALLVYADCHSTTKGLFTGNKMPLDYKFSLKGNLTKHIDSTHEGEKP